MEDNCFTTLCWFLPYSDVNPPHVSAAQSCLFATSCTVAHRLLCPWNSPGKILEWVAIPFSGGSSQPRNWNPCLPHCRHIFYRLSHQGSPNQPQVDMSPLPLKGLSHPKRHPTPLGYLRALGRAYCANRGFLPAICPTHGSVSVPVLLSHLPHPLHPLLCPQVCPLHLYLHPCPADKFISTIFLDSIYLC